ncbi:MAG: lamin tail domain-containing protein [Myxococcaceae bacterium]|nr:lamin tail domain-containing protein [Myxococcaceae bacterium]
MRLAPWWTASLVLVFFACPGPTPSPDGGASGGSAGGVPAGGGSSGGGAGGSMAGGSTAGGSTAGGSTAGGSTAGGSTAGGSAAGGSAAGGSTAGGSTAGGSTAGGSTAGGSTAGGSTAGGSSAGGAGGGSTAGGSATDAGAPDAGTAPLCTISGSGARRLITGTVLTPTGPLLNGQVALEPGGLISCVGTTCADGGQLVIACPAGVISPGLIDAHVHHNFGANAPRAETGERYEHRHDWRTGANMHTPLMATAGATEAVRWSELRAVLAGTTSTLGGPGVAGLTRNLDVSTLREGASGQVALTSPFPLGDAAGVQRTGDCNYGGTADTAASFAANSAYLAHAAEGVDRFALNEYRCMSSATFDTTPPGVSNDLLGQKTAFAFATALSAGQLSQMAVSDTSLIWSPRSNVALYGNTTPIPLAQRLGVRVALGTDWVVSGSTNLLRELACADRLNSVYFGNALTDEQLFRAVTSNAAEVAGVGASLGVLAPGRVADLTIFDGRARTGYRAVIAAQPQDVALVMRGSIALYGDASLISSLRLSGCEPLDVCGRARAICLVAETSVTYSQAQTAAGMAALPAFECGAPTLEPTCTPSRAQAVNGSTIYTGAISPTDADGDNLPDAMDACPTVFNPLRPVDNGVHPDADMDSVPDACDVCPLAPNTTNCTAPTPSDRDGDGVANALDNCPLVANPTQADGDLDGKGDACDPCPMNANPGLSSCPGTVYAVKDGTFPLSSTVALDNLLVTAKTSTGFFVQVKPGDAQYAGADRSGLFIQTGAGAAILSSVAVGNRVAVDGQVTDLFGAIVLANLGSAQITSSTVEAPPASTLATIGEITTGGTRAAALEGVLVTIGPNTVTAVNGITSFTATAGMDSITVGTLVAGLSPMPMVTQTFTAITGVLAWRSNASTLNPRGMADLATGAPTIFSFGPDAFTNAGQLTAAPTFPLPLTITLTGPALMNTFVPISSSNAAAISVENGGVTVAQGQTSAVVLVSSSDAGTSTLTAAPGMGMPTATVRAITPTEPRTVASLTPPMPAVSPGGSVVFTVTLDIPAGPAGAMIGLSLMPPTAGTLPATVSVLAGQRSATFTYLNNGSAPSATVSATLGTTGSATVTTQTGGGLVINEVDYDNPGTGDPNEFIELYNSTPGPISLSTLVLVLVNGANGAEYLRVPLASAGSLPANGYLVITNANLSLLGGARLTPMGWMAGDNVQNGAPDGVVLLDSATNTIIDRLSYEGSLTNASIMGIPGPTTLVEGMPSSLADSNTVNGSLCRLPNGTDTDNAATDWALSTTPTPGSANVP